MDNSQGELEAIGLDDRQARGGAMRRRIGFVLVGLLIAAGAGGYLVWRSRFGQTTPDVGVRSTVAQRGSMVVAVTASGQIEPRASVGLNFETRGRVSQVFVSPGDHVVAGDSLARLDTAQLDLQVEQAEAGLESAEAQLDQLRAGPQPEEIEQAKASVRAAEAQVEAAQANRDQLASGPTEAEVAAAEAQVAQAWTAREVAQDTYDTIEDDGDRKEQANYDLYAANLELAAAEASLEDLLAGASSEQLRAAHANVDAAVAQRDAAQAQLDQLLAGTMEEEIAEAQAQVAQARVALELAELALQNTTLRAPFDGRVFRVNVSAGEASPTIEPSLSLLDDSAFHITAEVDEIDIGRLEEGQEVDVSVDALPGVALKGTVSSVAPIASLDGGLVTYEVVVDLVPTTAPVRADMSANATIVVEELVEVLRIPTWVVRIDDDTGQTYVDLRVGDSIERRDVQLGARFEGLAQVISGISEGDEIVRLEEGAAFEFGRR
jgi:HlyD family secretion protein